MLQKPPSAKTTRFWRVFLKETRLSATRGELRRGASLNRAASGVFFSPLALQSACLTAPTAREHFCLNGSSAPSMLRGRARRRSSNHATMGMTSRQSD